MSDAQFAARAAPAADVYLAERPRRPLARLRRLARHPSALAGGVALAVIVLATLLAPALAPADPLEAAPASAREGPSLQHLLGTDHLGRDMLSRILYGGQVSLMLG